MGLPGIRRRNVVLGVGLIPDNCEAVAATLRRRDFDDVNNPEKGSPRVHNPQPCLGYQRQRVTVPPAPQHPRMTAGVPVLPTCDPAVIAAPVLKQEML